MACTSAWHETHSEGVLLLKTIAAWQDLQSTVLWPPAKGNDVLS